MDVINATSLAALRRRSIWVAGAMLLAACSTALPSGFWRGYRKSQITAQESLLEGRRGWLWVHWETDEPGSYSEWAAMHFAQENGWRFRDRRELGASELEAWSVAGEAVFPFQWPEPTDQSPEGAIQRFPRHITGAAALMEFDSGWTLEGMSETETAPGFVLISADGRRQAVYQLWGRW